MNSTNAENGCSESGLRDEPLKRAVLLSMFDLALDESSFDWSVRISLKRNREGNF